MCLCCLNTILSHALKQSFVVVYAQEAPPSHDILVFMTGQEEIEALARTCRDIAKHLPDSCGPMVVIPLYASLPPVQQLRVFQPAPKVNSDAKLGGILSLSCSSLDFYWLISKYIFMCQPFFRDVGKSFCPPILQKHLSQFPG